MMCIPETNFHKYLNGLIESLRTVYFCVIIFTTKSKFNKKIFGIKKIEKNPKLIISQI